MTSSAAGLDRALRRIPRLRPFLRVSGRSSASQLPFLRVSAAVPPRLSCRSRSPVRHIMHRVVLSVAVFSAVLGAVLSRPGDLTPLTSDVTEEQLHELRELWGVKDGADLPIPLIFPGTKWCGDGDIAANYSDLGPFAETDKCCREHDHCPSWIAGFGTNETIGLRNPSPFTRCACECDLGLAQCLSDVGSSAARTVGHLFDNILQIKCYRQDYPIVSCQRYGGLFDRSCQEYELDETSDKVWEFFDSQVFPESSEKDMSKW